ncbi:hypothetical protein GCM10011521_28220 [Arenimonas soli]|uniref:Uncharacterized protein n=1 Tax=Arenimonas soli TaxID=2269504 RepID=A0ABQ1HU99_9GAMM|nr:hypothetical protein GCM10011521_28220 [Arenimonas soli]
MSTIANVRSKSLRRSAGYWFWLFWACLFLVASWIAAFRIPGSAIFLFACVPFAVVAAQASEQAKINRALVAEIDEMRALLSTIQHASRAEPN